MIRLSQVPVDENEEFRFCYVEEEKKRVYLDHHL